MQYTFKASTQEEAGRLLLAQGHPGLHNKSLTYVPHSPCSKVWFLLLFQEKQILMDKVKVSSVFEMLFASYLWNEKGHSLISYDTCTVATGTAVFGLVLLRRVSRICAYDLGHRVLICEMENITYLLCRVIVSIKWGSIERIYHRICCKISI